MKSLKSCWVTVVWRPEHCQMPDFLYGNDGCGEKIFQTLAEAKDFKKELSKNTIQARFIKIYGHELEIAIS